MTAWTKNQLYPWFCWFIAAMLYLLSYGLLVFPTTITSELQRSLSIGPAEVGVIGSSFLYTYVAMQIPVGLMFDKYSARKLLFTASLVMAFGTLMLALSQTFYAAILSRMLMGLGASFTFVGAVYLGRGWFAAAVFPVVVGLTEALSGVGEITLPAAFAALKAFQSWHMIVFELSLVLFFFAALVFIFVHDKDSFRAHSHPGVLQELKILLKNKELRRLGVLTGFSYCHFIVMVDMWLVPVLKYYFHISTLRAVFVDGFPILGFTIGCLTIGYLTNFFHQKKILLVSTIVQLTLMIVVMYGHFLLLTAAFFLFVLGYATSAIILTFDLAKRVVPHSSYGIACGYINMFFGGVGILVVPLVGYILGRTNQNFELAAIPVVITSTLAVVLAIVLNLSEAKPQQQLS